MTSNSDCGSSSRHFPQWHKPMLQHQSLRLDQALLRDANRGSLSVVFVLVSSLAVPAIGCGWHGCTSPCGSCWIPLPHWRYSFRGRRSWHEVTLFEMIFGIQLRFLGFPKLFSLRPVVPHCRTWPSPHIKASTHVKLKLRPFLEVNRGLWWVRMFLLCSRRLCCRLRTLWSGRLHRPSEQPNPRHWTVPPQAKHLQGERSQMDVRRMTVAGVTISGTVDEVNRTRGSRFETAVMTWSNPSRADLQDPNTLSRFPQSSFQRSPSALPHVAVSSPFSVWSHYRLKLRDVHHWLLACLNLFLWSCGPYSSALTLLRVLWPSSCSERCQFTSVPLVLHHLTRFDWGLHRDNTWHTHAQCLMSHGVQVCSIRIARWNL